MIGLKGAKAGSEIVMKPRNSIWTSAHGTPRVQRLALGDDRLYSPRTLSRIMVSDNEDPPNPLFAYPFELTQESFTSLLSDRALRTDSRSTDSQPVRMIDGRRANWAGATGNAPSVNFLHEQVPQASFERGPVLIPSVRFLATEQHEDGPPLTRRSLLAVSGSAGPALSHGCRTTRLLNVSYDVASECYKNCNAAASCEVARMISGIGAIIRPVVNTLFGLIECRRRRSRGQHDGEQRRMTVAGSAGARHPSAITLRGLRHARLMAARRLRVCPSWPSSVDSRQGRLRAACQCGRLPHQRRHRLR